MKAELNSKANYKSAILALSIFTVISGILSTLFGVLVLPVSAASLAALMIYDKSTKRIPTVISACLVFLFNLVIGIFSGEPIPSLSLEIIFIAFVIAFMYTKGSEKGECAFWITAIASLFIVIAFVLDGFYAVGEVSLSALKEHYLGIYSAFKDEFLTGINGITSSLGDGNAAVLISPDDALVLFNSLVNSLISVIVICGFVIAGVTFKVFGAIVGRIDREPSTVYNWRFSTSNVFAYFYIALLLLSLFAGASTDIFSLTVSNLYTVLSVVYAYVGYNYVSALLINSPRRGFMKLVLFLALFSATSLAIGILSIMGITFTFTHNKLKREE
ncbi:MAG: hypothetical protein IJ488_06090 [Clostridia bacterium]|nr:hypothetical protein [Clostridia bacterium]